MKLALVGDRADSGGDEFERLADALERRGHDVRMFAAQHIGVVDGAAGADELMPLIGDIAQHLIDAWDADRPDVVHCFGWAHGMAAQLAAKRRPVPTVQAYPSLDVTTRPGDSGADTPKKIRSLLVRNATAVSVACHDDMDEVLRLGCPRARVAVLPPGVEVDDVTAEEILSRGTESGPRIVAVARDFTPRQGLAQVLRTLPSLGPAELVLVATHDADPEQSERHLELARRLRVDRRVRLVARPAAGDLTALFRSADVVVAPAQYESSCATVLHAMGCGAPIIAVAAGGPKDAVISDVTGLLVPPGKPEALGRALRSVLGQTVLRQGMGLAGRSRARSRYSWDRIATDAETIYEAALSRETATAR